MRIEISPTLQPDDENFRQAIKTTIQDLILSAIETVEAQANDIDAVIITRQDDFGQTIHQLQSAAGVPQSYTNNDIHVAAAKTIAVQRDGHVVSTIVYRDNFMAEILGDIMGFNGEPTFGEDAQFCYYLLAHEIGHCKDNALRSLSEGSEPHFDGEFRVEKVANYYCSIVLSELAACVHSAPAMTLSTYAQEKERWLVDRDKYLKRVKESWQVYQRNHSHLRNLTFDSAQAFWIILLQYAKLAGSRIGNSNLPNDTDSWPHLNADVVSAFNDVDEALGQIWSLYPDWTDATGAALIQHWQKLAQLYGYRFVQNKAADDLYLDNSIIESY